MKIYEMYKGVKIIKSLKGEVFCGSFPDGSWFGWSSLYDVKRRIDVRMPDYVGPDDIDSTFACMCDE